MARKAISKKLRFDIFKRDGFKCQYCGCFPPNVVLEVDHIVPVFIGGENNIENLTTSCFDCNRGKGAKELNVLPEKTADKVAKMKEMQSQYKEYKRWCEKIKALRCEDLDAVDRIYQEYFEGYCLSDKFKNSSLRKFIDVLGILKVEEFMHKACARIMNENAAIKYFCGICWNQIKNPDE